MQKGKIMGYYNCDFYIDKLYQGKKEGIQVREDIERILPIGKDVRIIEQEPECSRENLSECPHKGKCYALRFDYADYSAEFTSCMLKFEIINEEDKDA